MVLLPLTKDHPEKKKKPLHTSDNFIQYIKQIIRSAKSVNQLCPFSSGLAVSDLDHAICNYTVMLKKNNNCQSYSISSDPVLPMY